MVVTHNDRMTARGFILQASYRIAAGSQGQRAAVVHLYGRTEEGDTFLVRDERQRPHFYIRSIDAERARALRSPESFPSDKHSFSGSPVRRLDVETPQDVPGLRDRLQAGGIETFEADVRFALRYLIDRGIKGGCEIDGEWVRGEGVARVYSNPVLRPMRVQVEPRVLSFDIETDGKGDRLLAISLYAPGLDEVLIVDGALEPCRSAPPAVRTSALHRMRSAHA
jgi:DNA polymerase II